MDTATLIVGAGPAGLAIAGRLRHRGLDFELVERSRRIADAWHRHYDRLCLHTVKELSHLPHLPFPDHYPRYVPRALLVDYYLDYARRFRIQPRLGREVVRIERDENGWQTTTSTGEVFRSRSVVLATGVNRVPRFPHFPGMGSFGGEIVHSYLYRNPVPFLGRRALVVGMGNTGAEIALDLCEAGVEVAVSVRGPVNIVPRDVAGRPTQLTAQVLAKLPERWGDRIGVALRRLTVGDLSRFGIDTPELAPLAQLRRFGKTPVIDVGTVAAIKAGRIDVVPGIDRFTETEAVFLDGRRRRVDAVILATGYQAKVETLIAGDTSDLLDHTGVPRLVVGEGRYRGLYFLGYDNYQPGGVLGTVLRDSATIADRLTEGNTDRTAP